MFSLQVSKFACGDRKGTAAVGTKGREFWGGSLRDALALNPSLSKADPDDSDPECSTVPDGLAEPRTPRTPRNVPVERPDNSALAMP